MIKLYIYDKTTNIYVQTIYGHTNSVMDNIPEDNFTLVPPPNLTDSWKWVDGEWLKVDAINDPNNIYGNEYIWDENLHQWQYSEELAEEERKNAQDKVWEGIKAERLKQTTSGVYVPSVDKVFHTDDVSVIQYNNIGNMIALGNFEPIQWKVMDNSWITMTEEVFKDLQKAMVQNTNRIYQVAEEHKAKMLEMDNPEDYDYSEGWNIIDPSN